MTWQELVAWIITTVGGVAATAWGGVKAWGAWKDARDAKRRAEARARRKQDEEEEEREAKRVRRDREEVARSYQVLYEEVLAELKLSRVGAEALVNKFADVSASLAACMERDKSKEDRIAYLEKECQEMRAILQKNRQP